MQATGSLDAQVRALLDGAGAYTLPDTAVIAVKGRDRATWLNGVITQDVRALAPHTSVYAAAVGTKGKILADLRVLARADELVVLAPAAHAEALAAHFDRYIVMEDVTLEARTATVVTVQGPAAMALRDRFAESFTADRLGGGGFDVVADDPSRDATAAVDALVASGALVVASPEAWEVARLERGVARFDVDFDAQHFVQEAAITARAVSFHKGCYLGQEVVCRLEMRGHVQRHLVALRVGAEVSRGDAVTADGAPVGEVTSAAPSVTQPGTWVALAMAKTKVVDAGAPLRVREVAASR